MPDAEQTERCMDFDYNDSLLRDVMRWIVEAAAVIALAWLCVYTFGTGAVNSGQSMRPAIEDGERVLINRAAVKLMKPERFAIVLFEKENGRNIKRIIGLPGETVQIRDGAVYIDGEKLSQPEDLKLSEISIAGQAETPVTLGENEYFVLGDNRDASEDSRFESVGLVTQDEMIGTVWFRTAPFERIGRVK